MIQLKSKDKTNKLQCCTENAAPSIVVAFPFIVLERRVQINPVATRQYRKPLPASLSRLFS